MTEHADQGEFFSGKLMSVYLPKNLKDPNIKPVSA